MAQGASCPARVPCAPTASGRLEPPAWMGQNGLLVFAGPRLVLVGMTFFCQVFLVALTYLYF
jgi:hypothetical protein